MNGLALDNITSNYFYMNRSGVPTLGAAATIRYEQKQKKFPHPDIFQSICILAEESNKRHQNSSVPAYLRCFYQDYSPFPKFSVSFYLAGGMLF